MELKGGKMKNEKIIIGAICLIFFWLMAISFAIVDLYAYKEFILENLVEIYNMIGDVYNNLADIYTM